MSIRKKLTRKASANLDRLNTEVFVPLKDFSNFWRSLHLSLINCKTELDLSWSKNCVISEMSRTPEVAANLSNPVRAQLVQNFR